MQAAFKKNLEEKDTKKGRGIFTKVDVPKDSIIFEFTGNFFTNNQIPSPLLEEADMFLQIGKDLHLGPSGDLDDLMNHSCFPNCATIIIGKRVLLKAILFIPAGIEITYDYSVTSTDDKDHWLMNCKCGSFSCRKVISGFQYLDDKTKEHYKTLGIVPKYVLDKEAGK